MSDGSAQSAAASSTGRATDAAFSWDVRGVKTLVIRAVRSNPDEGGDLVLLDPVALGAFDDLVAQP